MEGHFDVDSLLLNPSRSLLNELSELDGHWSGKGQEVSYERGELPPVEPSENFPLGMGGAGSVFKVVWKHPKSKKQITFAEKRVSPSKNFPKELAKVEVTLLKKLQHRHIVSFVGSYEHNCIFHILILPCATCDLARLLDDLDRAKGQASPVPYFTELGWINPTSSADGGYFRRHAHERLGKLCGCITSAVLYLHDKKIRHKDIKPSNILIDRHSVYLTDFNVSKDFEEQDTTQTIGSTIHGTQRYLAPEIVKRETRGSKADIYSLGLVFMEIFTFLSGHSRQDMFDALGYDTGLERHLGTDRKRIAIYSSLRLGWAMTLLPPVELESKSGTRDLLLGMLHIDPSQRPDAYEVASQLATLDPDGKLHGECCQPHKGSVGFKALIAKYDNLREQHDQLLNRYEDMSQYKIFSCASGWSSTD
jgi:serine/threonine protein kinase